MHALCSASVLRREAKQLCQLNLFYSILNASPQTSRVSLLPLGRVPAAGWEAARHHPRAMHLRRTPHLLVAMGSPAFPISRRLDQVSAASKGCFLFLQLPMACRSRCSPLTQVSQAGVQRLARGDGGMPPARPTVPSHPGQREHQGHCAAGVGREPPQSPMPCGSK